MPHLCGARQLFREGSDEEEDREAADRHLMTHDQAKVVNELVDSGFKKLLSVTLKSAVEELVGDPSNKTEEGKIKKGGVGTAAAGVFISSLQMMQRACNLSRVDVISLRCVQVFVQLFNTWQDSDDAEHQEADVDAPPKIRLQSIWVRV